MTELTAMSDASANNKAKVFISYSRDDIDFADQFVAALEAFGFDPLIDRHSIPGGEDWKAQLRHMIVEADSVVFILSPRSATSKLCEWEVEEANKLNKRLIPIVCAPLGSVSVPSRLANLNYILFYAEPKRSGSGFGSGLARLTAALNTDLDWIRDHTRLGALAERWQARSRDKALLLRGDELTDAERWLARKPPKAPEPTELLRVFFTESRRDEEARLNKERQQLEEIAGAQARIANEQAQRARSQLITRWVITTAGAIVVIGGGIVAYLLWDEAQQLDRREVALKHAQANILGERSGTKLLQSELNSALRLASLGTSLDLSLPASTVKVSSAAAALAAAVSHANWSLTLTGGKAVLVLAAFSPDGSRIVAASSDKTARIWDAATAKEIAVLRHDDRVNSAAFSADGLRIVTASDDKTARIWDAATAKEIAVLAP